MKTKCAKHNHTRIQISCVADISGKEKQRCERELEAHRGDFETSASVSHLAWAVSNI